MGVEFICEYLEWDSQFFGRRIARVKESRITQQSIHEIDSWCRLHRIDCLYFLADSKDRQSTELAQENMFRFVDARMTFELSLSVHDAEGKEPSVAIRSAAERDIPTLQAIARRSHRDSRFYYDGNFLESLCDELYETWIKKSCDGWAKNVLVAVEGNAIHGYLTCHLTDARSGAIGLVGVAEHAQGKGVGKNLLLSAVCWFARQGVEKISVATQGRNVRAQRLYQRAGFVTRSLEIWFHRWFSEVKDQSRK